MDVAMWGQALRVIPQVDREQWQKLDVVARWLIAARSAVFVITAIAVGVAGLLALRDGVFNAGLFGLVAVGLIMAHATNNIVNDMTDWWKGVDRGNYFRAQYGPQPLEHGLMSVKQMALYAGFSAVVALAAGVALVLLRGGLTLPLLAAGAFFVLFYTWPLKYIGLGELAVLVVWGPLMIGGGYYVLSGVWSWGVVLASLPYALGATAVIFGKHIDKRPADREKGIRTLPVLLGDTASRYGAIAMMVAQYGLVVYLVATGFFTPALLIVALALPKLLSVSKIFAQPKPDAPPAEYADGWPLWFVSWAFVHNRAFGGLFLLGLLADVVLQM
ncbi:MAG: prenyltransferase [Longimicrobiales bacterium]